MNALFAQCGGPTSVVNASLAGGVERWRATAGGGQLWGSRFGLLGLVTGDWADLAALSQSDLAALAAQSGAALGSSRYRPADEDFPAIVARLRQAGVEVLCLIGGNGTMAAAARLERTARAAGYPLQVLGIPKTIDNDLAGTDVTPGYGSAARYIAHTTQECGLDLRAMVHFDEIVVIEVMGRHAGWLAAASALARQQPGDPPHLILVPEAPVAIEPVLARIEAIFAQRGICLLVAAEGVQDPEGRYWAELLGNAGLDASGQRNLSMAAGVAPYIAQHVQTALGRRCRQVRLNTAQRGSRYLASPLDRTLAWQVGAAALDAANAGASGVMIALRGAGDRWDTALTHFAAVIGHERRLPTTFFEPAAYDVTPAYRAYATPLAAPLPPAPLLWVA